MHNHAAFKAQTVSHTVNVSHIYFHVFVSVLSFLSYCLLIFCKNVCRLTCFDKLLAPNVVLLYLLQAKAPFFEIQAIVICV